MDAGGKFRRRILLVDDDVEFVHRCSEMLSSHGYEVLTTADGFGALQVLRGAQPDVIVTELDLQHMSGFELLSVVRTRFPSIAVIALSDEYTPVNVPDEAICDVFIGKGQNVEFEVTAEAERLVSESPLRASRPRASVAPVWIPKSTSGYIILTCPECLRSFSAPQPLTTTRKESCVFCGAEVPFQVSSLQASQGAAAESPAIRSRQLRAVSEKLRDKRRLK
jgi:CheY-like chemotaxis protein